MTIHRCANALVHDLNCSETMIVLLHMHDDAPFFGELGALTLANKQRYAARHGYELVAHTPETTIGLWDPDSCVSQVSGRQRCVSPGNTQFRMDKRAATFGKIKLAQAGCVGRAGYWMLWSDADALIVNQSIPLTDIIDDRYDLLMSVDWLMLNAGVILIKCSPWTEDFLQTVYNAREFDSAAALDQSSFQHHVDTIPGAKEHIRFIPKRIINVYPEEYIPGDFLLHMAGKLYEATTEGALALAHQFDVLSLVEDVEDIGAFFATPYLLSKFSGVCDGHEDENLECGPGPDDRRLQMREPLIAIATPNRYRHVGLRYYWLGDWTDVYDSDDWFVSNKRFNTTSHQTSLSEFHEEL
jgi:galactosyl transferase GMA12/MNN10 family